MGFITRLRPSSPDPEIATTVSHGTTQARTLLAAVLQATKQPGMPMVTLVTTSHEESWRMPAPRQTHDALLMLLLTPHEGLHPRLEAALLAIVVENLQDLSRTAKQRPGVIEAMKAMTAVLSTGCTLEEAYGSVPAAQRDALWQGGPYSGGDPASDLLLNYLALFQGKVIEMALNSRQYACTDYPQLPKGFDQKQASLEDRLRQVETPALTSEYLIQYRQLNQSLYRQEWFVQLPVSVAQQMSNWLLRYSLPSTAVARQLINYCQGQVSAQALGEQWQTIWSQLQQASTLREFLEGVNKALEQGVLTPVTVLYGLSNLSSTAVPLIPVSLMVAAMVGWGQEKFAGWLRDYVGSPSSEATRTLQELGRLAGNCASLKQYAQPALSSLNEWVSPASVPLGITQAVDNPGARAQSNADKHLLEQGGAQRWGHDLPPGVTEPPATSGGTRQKGIMQAAQHAVKHVVGSAFSLFCKTSSPDVQEETDVEAPLYQDPAGAASQSPTTHIAPAGQPWSGAVLDAVAALGMFMTGKTAVDEVLEHIAPDTIALASERVSDRDTAQCQDVKSALQTQLHSEGDGELSSTWIALLAEYNAARTGKTPLSKAKVLERLHTDFGPDLWVLLNIIAPQNTDAEFDAPEHVPKRLRRDVEQQASEADVAKIIIALLGEASSGAPLQEEWLREDNLSERLSHLPKGHWLLNATPKEQTLDQTLRQTLTEEVQHLAELRYDSQTQLKEHWPDLKQTLARISELTLELDLLKSSVKGDLSPKGAYLPGRDIVLGALKHDRLVEFGRLSLRLDLGNGADAILVPLPQLRVFVRRNDRGEEDGVVLWRGHEILGAFPSQQVMFEYLDFLRMRQSLYAEVRPPEMPVPATDANPTPKPLHELVRDNTRLSQWPAVSVALSKLGQKSADWKPEQLQFERYPGDNLREQFEQEAEAFLVEEDKRLQRLAANPELARQTAEALSTVQSNREWIEKNVLTLPDFARTYLTEKLNQAFQDVLPANATVDADAVLITFNGVTMSFTDWGGNGYRDNGDNWDAPSNNFLLDASIEHPDQVVVRALNSPNGKERLQHLMRSLYPGDKYIIYLEEMLKSDNPIGQTFRQRKTNEVQQLMQVTVEQARVDGTIDAYTAGEIKTLLDGLLTTTDTGKARLKALLINGKPMPEVQVISVSQRANRERTAEPIRRVYVYWRGPHGAEVVPLASFEKRVKISGADYDEFSALATLSNTHGVEAFQRGHSGARFSTTPIASFTEHVANQLLLDGIDNTREATISRREMITEQILKGARFGATALCMGGSLAIAAVPCGVVTVGLTAHDVSIVVHELKRGEHNFMAVADVGMNMLDVGPGIRALVPGVQKLIRSWYPLKLDSLQHFAGTSLFKSRTELNEAAQTMRRQLETDFTRSGRLNDGLARRDVTREQLTRLPRPPGKADAGIFYELDGKLYIQDRYQDQVQVYEVYSDNAWATVRVRDPQRPNGYGAPVHYRDGHWRVDDGGLLGGGKKQSKVMVKVADTAPDASPQTLTVANYEMPDESKSTVLTLLDEKNGLHEDYGSMNEQNEAVRTQFFNLRRKVDKDSSAIMSSERPPRPTLPDIPPQTSPADLLEILFAHAPGVVIGETHHSVASKKFIIDNMRWLAQNKVTTLYMEHFLSDMHSKDLKEFFKSGNMSKSLKGYLKTQDKGHRTDPKWTFEKLVIEAQKNGIEVRALDCAASYRLEGFHGQKPTYRQQMMNYIAYLIIKKDQAVAGEHKWIALVGNSHSNTYQDVPGVAELNGGIGVRVKDVPWGMETSIAQDTGELLSIAAGGSRKEILLKGDYLVQLPTLREDPLKPVQSARSIEDKLSYTGQFVIEQGQNGKPVIVHRSRDGQIHRTPVMLNAQGKYSVERETWTSVTGRNYDDMHALIQALEKLKMVNVTLEP